jgi:hypothetical protein
MGERSVLHENPLQITELVIAMGEERPEKSQMSVAWNGASDKYEWGFEAETDTPQTRMDILGNFSVDARILIG